MNLKRRAFLFLILMGFLILPFRVRAVELTKTFEVKVVDSCHNSLQILTSYDDNGNVDGYIVIRDIKRYGCSYNVSRVVKFNLSDQKVYDYDIEDDSARSFFSVSAISSSSDFNISGESDIILTLKDSNTGNIKWQKQYGGNSREKVFDYFVDYDINGKITGYVVLIKSYSNDIDGVDPGMILVKYNTRGKLLWQKNFSTDSFSLNSHVYGNEHFIKNDDGKVISYFNNTGYCSYPSNELIYKKHISHFSITYDNNGFNDGVIDYSNKTLIKYDLEGNIVFEKNFDISLDGNGKIIASRNVYGMRDGYLLIDRINNEDKSIVIKYDLNGNLVWKNIIDNFQIEAAAESYDEDGNFNGYIFLAWDLHTIDDYHSNCSATYIMKYTYPKYEIVSDNDKGGVITVNDKALAREVVRVEVKAREGYIVKRIVVKDESGNEIEVSSDGTFIMPEGKVTVSAIYERIENPDTVSASYIVLGIVLVISIGTIMILKRKKIKN